MFRKVVLSAFKIVVAETKNGRSFILTYGITMGQVFIPAGLLMSQLVLVNSFCQCTLFLYIFKVRFKHDTRLFSRPYYLSFMTLSLKSTQAKALFRSHNIGRAKAYSSNTWNTSPVCFMIEKWICIFWSQIEQGLKSYLFQDINKFVCILGSHIIFPQLVTGLLQK